jgi:tetrahydromethanopterin S-methyltransferase subunit H
MWQFENKQKVFDVGGVQVGGNPGEFPTVLIGSIFYDRHKIVQNPKNGTFDKKTAEKLLNKQDEMSEKTANPCMVDIAASTSQAMKKYVEFVTGITDAPILIDSSYVDVKISVLSFLKEIGLNNKTVYNSINWHFNENEINALKKNDAKAAIILTYNPKNVWPAGRVQILKGDSSEKGLLKIARTAGIEKPLIDTAVLDVPSIGLAAEALVLIKKEFGLPCGGGPMNAISDWKRIEEFGEHAKSVCMSNAVTAMQYAGANFILYGPIGNAEIVFPAAAMADALIAYKAKLHGVKPKTKNHPLFKIF